MINTGTLKPKPKPFNFVYLGMFTESVPLPEDLSHLKNTTRSEKLKTIKFSKPQLIEFEEKWLNHIKTENEPISFLSYIENQFPSIHAVTLKNKIILSLAKHGFYFENESELSDFCKTRCKLITSPNSTVKILLLDDKPICKWDYTPKIECKDGKITASSGEFTIIDSRLTEADAKKIKLANESFKTINELFDFKK